MFVSVFQLLNRQMRCDVGFILTYQKRSQRAEQHSHSAFHMISESVCQQPHNLITAQLHFHWTASSDISGATNGLITLTVLNICSNVTASETFTVKMEILRHQTLNCKKWIVVKSKNSQKSQLMDKKKSHFFLS